MNVRYDGSFQRAPSRALNENAISGREPVRRAPASQLSSEPLSAPARQATS